MRTTIICPEHEQRFHYQSTVCATDRQLHDTLQLMKHADDDLISLVHLPTLPISRHWSLFFTLTISATRLDQSFVVVYFVVAEKNLYFNLLHVTDAAIASICVFSKCTHRIYKLGHYSVKWNDYVISWRAWNCIIGIHYDIRREIDVTIESILFLCYSVLVPVKAIFCV